MTRRDARPSEAARGAADDWDKHWDSFGEAAERNPANMYRHRLVNRLLGDLHQDQTVLDIGCGQGQFALSLARQHPGLRVLGVDPSAEGIRRAEEQAARESLSAKFFVRDLLQPTTRGDLPEAGLAVCSEVLEHVPDPALLLLNARAYLAPGARVVITVPGGPRSAFDKHIGHYRHYDPAALRAVIGAAGLEVEQVLRGGFPFFNLYKLLVVARGEALVQQISTDHDASSPSGLQTLAETFFRTAFRLNRDDAPFGWQLAAVARVPA